MVEADYDLFFPEMLPYAFLMEKKAEDLHSFMTQYLNIATGSFTPTFDQERLHMIALDDEMLPIGGAPIIAWRFELAENPVCVGMAGVIEDGKLYVTDVVRGAWRPSTLAFKVVQMAKLYGAHNIEIEETPGAHHHEAALRNAATAAAWQLNIRWLPYDEDDSVRRMRIKSCEPLVKDGWVWLSKKLPHLKELIKQLYNYGLLEENELPDVFARLCAKLPNTTLVSDQDEADDIAWELLKQRDAYDRIYGLGQYAEVETGDEEPEQYVPQYDKGELAEIMPGLSG
jgi:hypothetical protein